MSDAIERGLGFIELCATECDVRVLIEQFQARIRDFGFTSSAGGGWSGAGRSRRHRFYFNDWPPDWMDIYVREKFFDDDPFVLESCRRMAPFSWHEIARQPQYVTARGRDIYNRARAYGWREVFGVPLHGPGGYQGLISMATLEDIELGPRESGILQSMATALHDRCRTEAGFGLAGDALPAITPREIECLQWAALGKTDWEIGQVLGVTEATAHYHIERAKKKLGVTSRVQAVAMLVLHGLA